MHAWHAEKLRRNMLPGDDVLDVERQEVGVVLGPSFTRHAPG